MIRVQTVAADRDVEPDHGWSVIRCDSCCLLTLFTKLKSTSGISRDVADSLFILITKRHFCSRDRVDPSVHWLRRNHPHLLALVCLEAGKPEAMEKERLHVWRTVNISCSLQTNLREWMICVSRPSRMKWDVNYRAAATSGVRLNQTPSDGRFGFLLIL